METILMILSARYWAFRRQHSSGAKSLLWLKIAFTFPLLINLMTLIVAVLAFKGFKPGSQTNATAFMWGYVSLLLSCFGGLHIFIKKHTVYITAQLPPEDYERGNNLSWLYFIVSFALLGAATHYL